MRDATDQICERDCPADMAETVALRILATTDMHMKLVPHDYLADRPCARGSLAQIALLVDSHRAAARNTLLLDNGDFLQGTPLGDLAARRGASSPASTRRR